jgi:ABC-type Na+ efflux pump permease subunit|tara:strand:+ start:1207 stop:1476 length:270 start_codon:yes stop_codon:yes gene_type:complete
VFGVLLLAISVLDVWLFDRQKITPQQMLTNELLVFVFGLILTIIVLVLSLVMAFKKRWRQSVLGLVSVLAYLVLFTASAHNGVALLYAT